MRFTHIIKSMRPHQYTKNLFIFLPVFFALKITNTELLINAILAFVAFSLSASTIYILNDYRDIEEDKQHPKKKYRPLAAGDISKNNAITLMIALGISGAALMSLVSQQAIIILGIYILLNLAYSFYLKQIAILDVSLIATGFVLRLFVGSSATDTPLSMWIVVMTFLLALFLALAKRRDDVIIYNESGEKMRSVIDGYNLKFLDAAMAIMASVVIVSYILYTTSTEIIHKLHSEYLYLTSIFVILGILRYLQITLVEKNSGSPSRIVIKDKFMQITIFFWLLSFVWILYL